MKTKKEMEPDAGCSAHRPEDVEIAHRIHTLTQLILRQLASTSAPVAALPATVWPPPLAYPATLPYPAQPYPAQPFSAQPFPAAAGSIPPTWPCCP